MNINLDLQTSHFTSISTKQVQCNQYVLVQRRIYTDGTPVQMTCPHRNEYGEKGEPSSTTTNAHMAPSSWKTNKIKIIAKSITLMQL